MASLPFKYKSFARDFFFFFFEFFQTRFLEILANYSAEDSWILHAMRYVVARSYVVN